MHLRCWFKLSGHVTCISMQRLSLVLSYVKPDGTDNLAASPYVTWKFTVFLLMFVNENHLFKNF